MTVSELFCKFHLMWWLALQWYRPEIELPLGEMNVETLAYLVDAQGPLKRIYKGAYLLKIQYSWQENVLWSTLASDQCSYCSAVCMQPYWIISEEVTQVVDSDNACWDLDWNMAPRSLRKVSTVISSLSDGVVNDWGMTGLTQRFEKHASVKEILFLVPGSC